VTFAMHWPTLERDG